MPVKAKWNRKSTFKIGSSNLPKYLPERLSSTSQVVTVAPCLSQIENNLISNLFSMDYTLTQDMSASRTAATALSREEISNLQSEVKGKMQNLYQVDTERKSYLPTTETEKTPLLPPDRTEWKPSLGKI